MPSRKVAKKTAKKGGTLDADLTSIAVPFGLLLAKQSLEKLSGTKVKATKDKKVAKNVAKAKTTKRMKRVVGGSNSTTANAANTGIGNAGIGNAVNVVNTGNASGANSSVTGGKSVKKGRGRPRSRVGGNNVPGVTNSTLGSGNVSGGRAKKSTKSKKGGKTTSKKTRKTQKGGGDAERIETIAQEIAKEILETNDLNVDNDAAINVAITKFACNEPTDVEFIENHRDAIKAKAKAQDAQAPPAQDVQPGAGGKSKAKRGRGRPRKN
jgi:hypothetical protein